MKLEEPTRSERSIEQAMEESDVSSPDADEAGKPKG
jgi:hypothetical protein